MSELRELSVRWEGEEEEIAYRAHFLRSGAAFLIGSSQLRAVGAAGTACSQEEDADPLFIEVLFCDYGGMGVKARRMPRDSTVSPVSPTAPTMSPPPQEEAAAPQATGTEPE